MEWRRGFEFMQRHLNARRSVKNYQYAISTRRFGNSYRADFNELSVHLLRGPDSKIYISERGNAKTKDNVNEPRLAKLPLPGNGNLFYLSRARPSG